MSISVCMATYNGEDFIKEQIESILPQLGQDDELIIIDDCSKDNTINIIQEFKDTRIKLYKNDKNKRHVFTFGRTIEIAKNDLIFLSDQDDLWETGRIEIFKNYFRENDELLISSSLSFFNEDTHKNIENPLKNVDSDKYFSNIFGIFKGTKTYYGCAMAFRKELKKYILPIPEYVESHDIWIAFAANLLKSNLHIEEVTVSRRIHNNNVSDPNRSIIPKLKTRFCFMFRAVKDLKKRIKKLNHN